MACFSVANIKKSAVGAAFPLFIRIAIDNIGVEWVCTIFGCIALILAPIPLVFYKYGARMRGTSSFAPCIDLKIKKMMEEGEKSPEKKV
jgi:DHA1 family multidrug resistance protein-like MFS transporter